ncbi:MAG: hypothetical protein R3286_11080 [Gammaproteobacteria bacterium]|nr:hypothetical protein [Gammaproteobacteria bacterium]
MSASERDRFGNPIAPGLAYARGEVVPGTAADLAKLEQAWRQVRERLHAGGRNAVFQLSGLERVMRVDPAKLADLDDELAPVLYGEALDALGLEHLGGDPGRHAVLLLNRLTAALLAAADVMIEPGDTVLGVSARYSHPAVVRAAAHGGGQFRDCVGADGFAQALAGLGKVDVVFLTRLAVSYEILPLDDIRRVIALAREAGARIIVDDAGGARVGPAVFDQPRSLELDVDVAATGLDKYGTEGPRLGLLGGRRELVEAIRARAYELGVEARPMLYPAVVRSLERYRPERVRELVDSTRAVAAALRARLGAERLFETPVTVQIRGEDLLEMLMARSRLNDPPVVPYEATAGLAMLLLRDYGVFTVHFAGLPPGTSALMIKFVPPETLARFGGAERLAEAIDASIDELARVVAEPGALRALLLGADATSEVRVEARV